MSTASAPGSSGASPVSANAAAEQKPVAGRDFFVSYDEADQLWAEWVAWELEAAGYRVVLAAWDFVPGHHRLIRTGDGLTGSRRTVAVVSSAYLRSASGRAQWHAALAADLLGADRALIPVRVEDCPLPGAHGQIVCVDVFGLPEAEARALLLRRIAGAVVGRDKPVGRPGFPGRARFPERSAPPPTPRSDPRPVPPSVTPPAPGRPTTFHGHVETVTGLSFLPDGRWLATAGRDRALLLWDTRHGDPSTPRRAAPGVRSTEHRAGIESLAVSSVGSPERTLLATGSRDRTAILWDASAPPALDAAAVLTGHTDVVGAVAFLPDGKWLATGGWDGVVRLWDTSSPTRPVVGPVLPSQRSAVVAMDFCPTGRWLVTGSWEGTALLWDMSEIDRPRPVARVPSQGGPVRAARFSPSGAVVATGGWDGVVQLHDVAALKSVGLDGATGNAAIGAGSPGHVDGVTAIAFSPDGAVLASCGRDGVARVSSVPAMTTKAAPVDTGVELWSIAFSPDGTTLAAGARNGTVRAWARTDR